VTTAAYTETHLLTEHCINMGISSKQQSSDCMDKLKAFEKD
jgi:hypothetical protein